MPKGPEALPEKASGLLTNLTHGPLPQPRPIGLAKGLFTVPDDFNVIPQQREKHLIASLALDEAAVTQLSGLPALHRDPFDRMLLCQAQAHGLTLAYCPFNQTRAV